MMAIPDPVFVPDQVAQQIAPGGDVTSPAVTFQGWLSDPKNGVYRVFTDPGFREWVEVKAEDMLHQLQSETSSTIWVKRDAIVTNCLAAEACHIAEEQALAADPTAAYPAAKKYPPR